jgi:hypothetical protein
VIGACETIIMALVIALVVGAERAAALKSARNLPDF